MSEHVKFPKIGGLHNVVKTMDHMAEFKGHYVEVQKYRAKVKLHGANMGVRVDSDGTLTGQSRNQDLDNDGHQFPLFIKEQADYFAALACPEHQLVVFGEWAGPGIQKKVSVCDMDQKAFFVFALMERSEAGNKFIFEPVEIEAVLTLRSPMPDHLYVIPWFTETIDISFGDKDRLREQSAVFNADVAKIDACDPYIKDLFGIEGTGEGLVYFPLNKTDREDFGRFAFKVKGERHSKGGGEKKARVQTPVAENVMAFAEMMVTPARVLQGAEELFGSGPYEKKDLGPLIRWALVDVKAESQDELEVSGVNWEDAMKIIPQKVREHFFAEIEKI